VRYEDQKLIRDYCKLGLAIAAAKNPNAKHDVSEAETLRRGYLMLKARMEQMGPKKKAQFRAMLQGEIRGVQQLMAKAKASGEEITLADIEVDVLDLETREVIPHKPNVQLETDEPSNENKEQAQ
jgi:hypothetical protein